MHFDKHRFKVIFLMTIFCLACSSGCSLRQDGSGDYSQSSRKTHTEGPPLFKPLNKAGAFPLSRSEAEELSHKMNKNVQKLGSWKDMSFSISQSLAYASGKGAGNAFSMPGLGLSYAQLSASLKHLNSLLPRLDSNPGLLAQEFTWYRLGPDFGITGYYEPTLKASRKKTAAHPYPLYRVPGDLRKGVPYHTRNAIDRKGALAGKGLEIAWVSSETDAFFLHIQGSGRLVFDDGSITHVLYAGKNNRAYVPLGRVMRDRGMINPDNVNMQSIRQCLIDNPDKCAELFDTNPSYVFFREAAKGPIGGMGRPLTPWVSTATDRSVLPHGSLIFLATPLPDNAGQPNKAFYGLTLPQDTGGAIKKNRIDLFCGPGAEAAHVAGYQNFKGAVYILVKK